LIAGEAKIKDVILHISLVTVIKNHLKITVKDVGLKKIVEE
jgi:hypothetical protein